MNTELTCDLAHTAASLADGLADVVWALSVLTTAPDADRLLRRVERLGGDLRELANEIALWGVSTHPDDRRSGSVYALRGVGKLAAHMREAAGIAGALGGEDTTRLEGLLDQAYVQALTHEQIVLFR